MVDRYKEKLFFTLIIKAFVLECFTNILTVSIQSDFIIKAVNVLCCTECLNMFDLSYLLFLFLDTFKFGVNTFLFGFAPPRDKSLGVLKEDNLCRGSGGEQLVPLVTELPLDSDIFAKQSELSQTTNGFIAQT